MKTKIKNIIIGVTVILLFASCEKEMIDFQGGNGVFFQMTRRTPSGGGIWPHVDTSQILFSATLKDDTICMVKFKLFGRVTNYDRTMKIKVLPTSTAVEGREYDAFPLTATMYAGRDTCEIPITMHRNEAILNAHKYLTLEIEETTDFWYRLNYYKSNDPITQEDVFVNVQKHTIDINDDLFRPTIWNDFFFGPWTDGKFRYINETFELKQDDWKNQQVMPFNKMRYMAMTIKRYIAEMDAAGTPIYEKDRKGEIVYQKDSKGEYILDEDGNKIPVKLLMGVGI